MPRFQRIALPSSATTSLLSSSPCTTPTSERSAFTLSPSTSASPPATSNSPAVSPPTGCAEHEERTGEVVVIKVSLAAFPDAKHLHHSSEVKLLVLPSSPAPPLFAVSSRAAELFSLPSVDASKGDELVLSLVEREARWKGDEAERVEMSEETWGLYGWRKAARRSREWEPVRVEVGVRKGGGNGEEKESNRSKSSSNGIWWD
ncbi:hypothetical protein JCM6882_005535 [Rhodosporidiobolus microsporus]